VGGFFIIRPVFAAHEEETLRDENHLRTKFFFAGGHGKEQLGQERTIVNA